MTDRLQGDATDARRWLPPVLLLLASAALASVLPLFRLVSTADGSTAQAAVGTGWLAAFPVLVALIATVLRRELGIAVVAGAGALGVGRLLADLGLIFEPDAVLRPELFGVQSVSAFPLTTTSAAVLPLVADLLAIGAAGLAVQQVLDGYEPPEFRDSVPDGPERVRPFRATRFTLVGLVAVGLIIASSLSVLYASPVPVVRPLGVADIGLFGTAGAALGGLVLCLVVLVAAVLPLDAARGLVIGAGTATAVPPLIVLLAGGEVRPSGTAWLGLVGSVLLVATSMLMRPPGTPEPAGAAESDTQGPDETRAVPIWPSIVLAVLALVAAGCAAMAYLRPQATSALGLAGASFDAAGAGFLPAAILLAICGLAAGIPATARWGRVGLALAWIPVSAALLGALEFTSSSIWVSSAVIAANDVQRSTGSWWGTAAVGLAVVAAIAAPVLSGRHRDTSEAALDPVEEPAEQRRRSAVGSALTVILVATYAFPVFSANDRPSAALFVGAARVDTYGEWLSVLGLGTAVWIACRSRRRSSAVIVLTAAALVVLCRIALPPAVRHQVAFELQPGFYLTIALVLAVLIAAVLLRVIIGAAQTGSVSYGTVQDARRPGRAPAKTAAGPAARRAAAPVRGKRR